MGKIHGDFGDLTRYDVLLVEERDGEQRHLVVRCQDCAVDVATYVGIKANVANVMQAASEHETTEEDT